MGNIQKTNGAQNSFVKIVFDNIVLCAHTQTVKPRRKAWFFCGREHNIVQSVSLTI